MQFAEIIARIPLMFYVSLVFLPMAINAYARFSKRAAAPIPKDINPEELLKSEKIDINKEIPQMISMAALLAFITTLIASSWWLISDYQNSRGIFSEDLAATAFPPSLSQAFPPAPTAAATENNNTN